MARVPQAAGEHRELVYGRHLRTAFRLGCNLVVLDAEDAEWAALRELPPDARRIDVLTAQWGELELQAEKARRRAARLTDRAQRARQDALDLGILPQQATAGGGD